MQKIPLPKTVREVPMARNIPERGKDGLGFLYVLDMIIKGPATAGGRDKKTVN